MGLRGRLGGGRGKKKVIEGEGKEITLKSERKG